MPTAKLDDRAIVSVHGDDARHFLQNLITTDLDGLQDGEIMPGTLLTPQGKILFDFLISNANGGFHLDFRKDVVGDFIKRLMLYRLRAKVEISQLDQADVSVSWDADSAPSSALNDRRFPSGDTVRVYGQSAPEADAAAADWHAHRIAFGVGESGDDYPLGEAFPHDVLLDHNGGVSFKKGCFVGQEVVSRMQHRGTARRRLLIVQGSAELPATGSPITAGDREIGTLGSTAGDDGLAIVRIDRAAQAIDAGQPIMAGDVEVELSIPAWADFQFPATGKAADGS